jgi:hypothetical protein
MWLAACSVCRMTGPKRMALNAHLSRSDPAYVAQQYAKRYSQSVQGRALAPRVGGVAAERAIVYRGCLAGFRARGRP